MHPLVRKRGLQIRASILGQTRNIHMHRMVWKRGLQIRASILGQTQRYQ
jgi:hypothetical protein